MFDYYFARFLTDSKFGASETMSKVEQKYRNLVEMNMKMRYKIQEV